MSAEKSEEIFMQNVERTKLILGDESEKDVKRDSVWSKTELEKKEGDGIINYSWRSLDFEEWNKGLVLDYRLDCRREFYPTIFFLPFSGLINFESRD